MKPVDFPESNVKLTAPSSMGKDECGDLPAFRQNGYCISCWELSDDELMEILQTKRVWLWVYAGETQPPVALGTDRPFVDSTSAEGGSS